ncbi:MAG: efflux RND transporter permease subunit [Bryobacterales bacterium]|nr:efflux RND transporter permease subunit [Bryobacterales bacterium]
MKNLFYRNPRLLILTLILATVAGLLSMFTLPRLEDPRLIKRSALVITSFPGAPADRVESLVTKKIEDQLREVESIKFLDSTSRAGISVVQVELREDLTEVQVEQQWSRIRDKVGDAQPDLPVGASEPELNLEDTEVDAFTMVVGLVWEPAEAGVLRTDTVPYAVLRRKAEILQDRLRNVSGTKQVELYGNPGEELLVEVDAGKLANLNVSAQDIATVLSASDPKQAAGLMRGERSDLQIEVAGRFETVDRIREIPVRVGATGQSLRLGDLADVRKTIASPPAELAFLSGKPALVVAARMDGAQRIDSWRAKVGAVLNEFQGELPGTVRLQTLFDQNIYVARRLEGLFWNFLMSTALVIAVTLWMMGARSALVVGLALPLTSLMVLAAMNFYGLPLHQMSVTGLIIALGLMIDNAIIVVDEVRHHMAHGMSPADAVSRTVGYLAVPLLGSTLTTMFSFGPIALMPGGAGEFVGPIALSVIFALGSSLLLALSVVPALIAYAEERLTILNRLPAGWLRDGYRNEALADRYGRFLSWAMARPALAMALSAALPLVGFVLATRLNEQFFPPAEREQFQIQMMLPNEAALRLTAETTQRARDLLLQDPAVLDVHWFAGKNAPKFYYNMLAGDNDSAFYAQAMVELRSGEDYFNTINRLQMRMDSAFPGSQMIARQLEQGPPFNAPVEMYLYGADLEQLHAYGEQLRSILASVPGITHTRTSLQEGLPKLSFEANDTELRLAGLPVRVRVSAEDRASVGAVGGLHFVTQAGGTVRMAPASALGEFRLLPVTAAITRRDGLRVNKVRGYLQAGMLPSQALAEYQRRIAAAGLQLPQGLRMEVGGESKERDDAVGNLLSSVGILVVLMVGTLVLSLGSFRLMGLIFTIAGLSAGSGFVGLWLFGYPFGFTAIIGIMGLIGLAINTAIIVLTGIGESDAARAGDPDAVQQVVLRNTRHILATTVTTIIGFLPLLIAGGGFWPPMAIAICGGVLGGMLLGLLFAPGAYLLLARNRRSARRDATVALPVGAQS